MTIVPSLSCKAIQNAFIRNGFRVVRQKGSQHRPVKRSTLQHIIKDAGMSVEEFLELI